MEHKKAKKNSTKKNKKASSTTKLVFKIIAVVLAVGLLFLGGVVFSSNGFAMLNIFHPEAPIDILNRVVTEETAKTYHILQVESNFTVEDVIDEHISATFYLVKLENDTYEFTAQIKEVGYELYNAYYQDGIFYSNKGGTKTKQSIGSVNGVMDVIFQALIDTIFPFNMNPFFALGDEQIETSFVCSLIPFYLGQKYDVTCSLEGFSTTVHLDTKGNMRYRHFSGTSGVATQDVTINYPKTVGFTLNFPDDLTNYVNV